LKNCFIKIGIHIFANEEGVKLVSNILNEAERVADDIMIKSHGGFIAYEEKENEDGSTIQLFKVF
jgi:ABC-type multidrug transport system ATPase subunit